MKIVVISPTYNEKPNIERMIPLLEEKIFPNIKNHEMFFLVVDDNSPDGTGEVVKQYIKKYKNISLLTGEKKGLGEAYLRGMEYAIKDLKADAVIEFDADFQHDPDDIPRLITAMDGGADHVIGSRYIKGGSIPKEWGIDRKLLSFFGGLFTRIVWLNFTIHDMTSGLKLTKTSFLKKVDLENLLSRDFAYKLNILHDIIKMKAKIVEIPIVFKERTEGVSKISKKDQMDSLYVVMRLGLRDFKKFIKFLIVGGVGFMINALALKLLVDAHWHPSAANLVGAALAIFSNYNFNNVWTFKEHRATSISNYFLKLIQFYGTSAFGVIFIQTGTIFIGTYLFGRQYYFIYFLLGTGFLLFWNFFMYNKFIWKKKH